MSAQPSTHLQIPAVWLDSSGGTPVARSERRINARIRMRLPMAMTTGRAGVHVGLQPVTMRNLSGSGIGFVSRTPVRLGEIVTVQIQFERWSLRTLAVVRFVRDLAVGQQVGCELVEMRGVDAQRLIPEVMRLQQRPVLPPG